MKLLLLLLLIIAIIITQFPRFTELSEKDGLAEAPSLWEVKVGLRPRTFSSQARTLFSTSDPKVLLPKSLTCIQLTHGTYNKCTPAKLPGPLQRH